MEPTKQEHEARLSELAAGQALVDDVVSRVYFNSFSIAVSGTGDATLLLKVNEKPVCVLHTPLGSLKDMAERTMEVISEMEKSSGVAVLSTRQFMEKLGANPKGEA